MVVKNFDKYLARILIFLLFTLSFWYYASPNGFWVITGFTTGFIDEPTTTFTDNINLLVNESYSYVWQPNNNCIPKNCKISSIKLTGYALSNQTGDLRIKLQSNDINYLIINKTFQLFDENLTLQQQSSFWDECIETCDINIDSNNLSINFEQNPSIVVIINSITYTFSLLQNTALNNSVSENIPIKTINKTVIKLNETINKSLDNFKITQKNFSWLPDNYTYTGLSIVNNAAYFDGNPYVIVPDSNNVNPENKTIVIETEVRIDGDDYGVIVSKYDSQNKKYFQLMSEPGGIIGINYGDGAISEFLESAGSFNDKKFHEVKVTLNRNEIFLYVDNVMQANETGLNLDSFDSDAPVSIGANVGYFISTGLPEDNFVGHIKYARVYYKD